MVRRRCDSAPGQRRGRSQFRPPGRDRAWPARLACPMSASAGSTSARRDRLELISERTERLLGRMNAAIGMANSKVLFNPKQSPAVGQVEPPCRGRSPRVSRAARDRVRTGVLRGKTMEGSSRRALGLGARDGSIECRHCQELRWRNPRPGQISEGQALQPDRRAKAPSERKQSAAGRAKLNRPPVSHTGSTGAVGTAEGDPIEIDDNLGVVLMGSSIRCGCHRTRGGLAREKRPTRWLSGAPRQSALQRC